MVGGADGGGEVGQSGGHRAVEVADPGRAERFVERRPVGDPVAEPGGDGGGVLGEALGGVPYGPAAAVLLGLREVPVVEGRERADPGRQQAVHQPVVEVQAGLVDPVVGERHHARPGDREPVGAEAEPAHQRDVLGPAVVVVAGGVAGVAAGHPAGGVREGVPDRRGAPVGVRRALDLVGGGGGAPEEVVGQGVQGEAGVGHGGPLGVVEEVAAGVGVPGAGHLTAPAVSPATR